ncbi:SpoIVB peptidase S55 [Telmatobacter bradus]|uniref:SpoIVB peptidase S55 n=1 Tax=Telmatobacter bradus TaxID=474953 RepID=UPI003B4325B7
MKKSCFQVLVSSVILAWGGALLAAQAAPPPSTGGFFPLDQVRAGMKATAWTVFRGVDPEPMDVEILGVLRGARGPGQDMILAQLHGAKPEYTGVVAGMSGSPVYADGKLLGALSYRIGQFSRDPIAGITPIAQMLEVRDLPLRDLAGKEISVTAASAAGLNLQPMETPLVLSGFNPEAVRFWQQTMAGTGLEQVVAGGSGASEQAAEGQTEDRIVPGSAVSMQLVRGDVEMAATCTVTYIDPKQLLACGHPVLQAGTISLPMTASVVVATLASPLNAFKIINTGRTIGAFTEDRNSAIRGVLGAKARMIPLSLEMAGGRTLHAEILDQEGLTPQVAMAVLYQALQESNRSHAEASYHLTGRIRLGKESDVPVDQWAVSAEGAPAQMSAALAVGDLFQRLYASGERTSAVLGIELRVEQMDERAQLELEQVRLLGTDSVHAGDTVTLAAMLRPWRQEPHAVQLAVQLPARLQAGVVRLLVSDSGTLDRLTDPPLPPGQTRPWKTLLAASRQRHAANRLYASLLLPEADATVDGQELSSLPLSVVNVLERPTAAHPEILSGETPQTVVEIPTAGPVTGFQVISLRILPGAGLN